MFLGKFVWNRRIHPKPFTFLLYPGHLDIRSITDFIASKFCGRKRIDIKPPQECKAAKTQISMNMASTVWMPHTVSSFTPGITALFPLCSFWTLSHMYSMPSGRDSLCLLYISTVFRTMWFWFLYRRAVPINNENMSVIVCLGKAVSMEW